MNGYQGPMLNPYGFMQAPAVQSTQVIRVSGENGARALQIGPNSSALLLDESGVMVWLVTSDGAGYKTVTAYDITPHQEAPAKEYTALEDRIKRLEEMIDGYTGNITADRKKQSDFTGRAGNDGNNKRFTESASRDRIPGGE